jgi:predicted AAA+ superfamily ATPase
LPEYILETTRDWIYGELAREGRSRSYLIAVLQAIIQRGGNPLGFTKLAREAGLANNTVASDYVDQLSDLFVVGPSFAWEPSSGKSNYRRPCKFHFVNLLAALCWMQDAPRSLEQLRRLSPDFRGALYEWLGAQELMRRKSLLDPDFPEQSNYWLSERHELDFVLSKSEFIEIKSGRSSVLEFSWFPIAFPKAKLSVVSESSFNSSHVDGLTWHDWLMQEV